MKENGARKSAWVLLSFLVFRESGREGRLAGEDKGPLRQRESRQRARAEG